METKKEIIGILFAKLEPSSNDVFADIGSGSGAVAEFFSNYVDEVYAIEVDEGKAEMLRRRFKSGNVQVMRCHGYDFLKERGCDIVFFGGTKDIERMLEVCEARKIAVNAARIEVATDVVRKMKEIGIFEEIIIVNVSKSYDLAGGTAFKNINPVFMIFGSRR